MGPHHTRLGRERFGLRSEAGEGVRGFERGDGVGYEEGEKKRRRRGGEGDEGKWKKWSELSDREGQKNWRTWSDSGDPDLI
jgi:hypothetical protein